MSCWLGSLRQKVAPKYRAWPVSFVQASLQLVHKNVLGGRPPIPIASISSLFLCRHCDVLEVDVHTGGCASAPLMDEAACRTIQRPGWAAQHGFHCLQPARLGSSAGSAGGAGFTKSVSRSVRLFSSWRQRITSGVGSDLMVAAAELMVVVAEVEEAMAAAAAEMEEAMAAAAAEVEEEIGSGGGNRGRRWQTVAFFIFHSFVSSFIRLFIHSSNVRSCHDTTHNVQGPRHDPHIIGGCWTGRDVAVRCGPVVSVGERRATVQRFVFG